jgi:hypothetical protein
MVLKVAGAILGLASLGLLFWGFRYIYRGNASPARKVVASLAWLLVASQAVRLLLWLWRLAA